MITLSKVSAAMFGWLWFSFVLVWPVVKWGLSLIVFYHFIRMLYFWNDPEASAGLVFLAYFSLLTLLTFFVSNKPKNI